MTIVREADYAIRVVLHLAQVEDGKKVSAATLSKEEKIPYQFLLTILRKLKQEGIVQSFMGSKGGYTLKVPPRDISIRDIVEIISGPATNEACLEDRENCKRYPVGCIIYKKLEELHKSFLEDLDSINFENILNEKHG